MQGIVHKIWYQNHWLQWLLWPLSWLFGLISGFRRMSFLFGLSKQHKVSVPVIIVGNITAGGSGKTPMVIHLIELLRAKGYTPGVVSRGYGAKIEGVVSVTEDHTPEDIGDEPAMIFARTKVPMIVGAKRVDAAQALINTCNVNVIISDDGLQHYALGRDIEIAIIDGERRLGNKKLIPAGPLREPVSRLSSVDFVIVNGGNTSKTEFLMTLEPSAPIALKPDHKTLSASDSIVAMAGIGNPQRFFNTLTQLGFNCYQKYEFADHQIYHQDELLKVAVDKPLMMTEKDAIKCRQFAQSNWWYLPVAARLTPKFDAKLLQKLAQIT
ncbi:tetraacyldisaccharide 4'-kinase [Parashewanella spongiae]|uniref:Tetraacyldisaccharide 4'-kinase n=1 Tax=Parashewanella spongiae TaxID=342950 RepID=A0A3A6TZ07_9GAMM|nr:tetraacyldisaccharide 4'-kinase [Parashewanella spongiae]MCL1077579.1 tetraacyldisaccharide 4'-kinase [Parashewanella spongiae]RJY18203.1 tetraacyldisaccharide 4'-kinase [Parashewanella spongiae]